MSGDRFAIVRCETCGLALTVPAPLPGRMSRYYPTSYYGDQSRYGSVLEGLLDRLYAARARRLERRAGVEHGTVLDVGCGRGQLLAQLRARGWRAIGTELSDEAAAHARTALHLDVRTGDVTEIGVDIGNCDLVVLWHVLEHVADPANFMAKIATLLRPGGTVLVAVPNFGSPEARLSGPAWFHLDVPRHLCHFDAPALQRLLLAAGLTPFAADYVAPEYDIFSFVQTVLNGLGIRHNLLYNLIRSRGAKPLDAAPDRVATRDVALTLMFAPLLAVLALVYLPLAAALRRSATIAVYARKG